MIDRFAQFPRHLRERVRTTRLGDDVPALVAHPDWLTPAPLVLWMHGRTVSKELDSGRYLRWIRAGIAVCAIDMPGHGERFIPDYHTSARTLDALEQVLGEIDPVIDDLTGGQWSACFDPARIAIGGMSLGGMATYRRLCDPHRFICATVEATTGWLVELYFPAARGGIPAFHPYPKDTLRRLDPGAHLDLFRPIPLLALHSEQDQVVPIATTRGFIDRLRSRYTQAGADPSLVQLRTWPETGAPQEHAGFGKVAAEAKTLQVDFLARWLQPGVPHS